MADNSYMLAIDTATRYAGLALYDGDRILSEASWLSNNNHSVELMPALVRMLDQQALSAPDLAAVAVAIGPGSFTGLRIGLSVAKGLAQALKIPILGVPTLDIVAFQHSEQRPVRGLLSTPQRALAAGRGAAPDHGRRAVRPGDRPLPGVRRAGSGRDGAPGRSR